MVLAEGFSLPKSMRIKPCGEYSGRGEDSPIMDYRMERDGWELMTRGDWTENKFGSRIWVEYKTPETWKRANEKFPRYDLVYQLVGVHERDGAFYLTDYLVRDTHAGQSRLGRLVPAGRPTVRKGWQSLSTSVREPRRPAFSGIIPTATRLYDFRIHRKKESR